MVRLLIAVICVAALAGPAGAAIDLQVAFPALPFFDTPVGMVDPMDGTDRLFVMAKDGFIQVIQNDPSVSTKQMFLNLEDSTANNFESGLLGLAFHPDYENNGYFYVSYINKKWLPIKWVLERYHVSADPNVADPTSAVRLIEVPQVTTYHKAGQLVFGPDGYLYATMGEDGQIYDAQSLSSLKGKMLRIDVDNPSGGKNYGIPPDNPFAGNNLGYKEEIWAWGLRNPWRFSIDAATGHLWLGDVGLDTWEEVNIIKKGRNYGWPKLEADVCMYPQICDTTGYNMAMPLHKYIHNSQYGAAVIGGYVYHGTQHPELVGRYIYADHPTDYIWALSWDGVNPPTNTELFHYAPEAFYRITAISQDKDNELFFVGYYGGIFKMIGTATGTGVGDAPPAPAAILSAHPNPFSGETRIHYDVAENASLDIFNVRGQLVRRVAERVRGSGEATWDGRDQAGRSSASGVYFARLTSGGKTFATQRIVLLK